MAALLRRPLAAAALSPTWSVSAESTSSLVGVQTVKTAVTEWEVSEQPHLGSLSYFPPLALSPLGCLPVRSFGGGVGGGPPFCILPSPAAPQRQAPPLFTWHVSPEVSEIATRFHVTETSPALLPPPHPPS